MENILLRPRSATEIVDAAFRLCRAHYGLLITVTGVMVAPGLLLKLALPAAVSGFGDAFLQLLSEVSEGVAIVIVSEIYLGRPADGGAGIRAVRGRVGALILAAIASNLLILLGLVLLIVPGVFLWVATFAIPMAIVLERLPVGASFTRARELVEEHIGHVLGTLVLLVVILGALYTGMMFAVEWIGELVGLEARTTELLQDVGGVLLYPAYYVGVTLLYYDLRIRREGFDLQQMAQDLTGKAQTVGAVAPADPRATAPSIE